MLCTHRHSGPQGSIEPFTVVDDPSAWLAEDFKGKEESFIYHFTEQDLKEIDAAIAKVEAKGLRIEVGICAHWPQLLVNCLIGCLYVSGAEMTRISKTVF